ncbi:MAG: hypothetical protein AAB503_00505 [Patescibacteria group bacterium]
MDKIVVFCKGIRKKYADWDKYEYYHILITSSDDSGKIFIKQDFPGKDSIDGFLDKLLAEFPKRKNKRSGHYMTANLHNTWSWNYKVS